MQRDGVQDWLDGRGSDELRRPEVGALLLAMPALGDPTFDRTVVLIVGDYDEGYQGVILSEPTRDDVRVALPRWWRSAMPPRKLHRGGPCDYDLVLCLAVGRPGLDVEGLVEVKRYRHQSLYRVEGEVDPDAILSAVSGVRLFQGYSGWSPGQLELEIDEGAWLVVPSHADDAVSPTSATLWRGVLARQQGDAAFLRSCPDNPARN
ncbi:YqgE/AlgH family protein [Blastococcus sp. Marseille-P5729]|uniref:YqgE/AlgH family protein n=1 Tax=Blastococcus sp. Marseille-P5729 TaxID=2086582 RepID=UPI000D0ED718|nr:YqgE/AlgH family protein [Blastococcus sp. Marseille-P5729]